MVKKKNNKSQIHPASFVKEETNSFYYIKGSFQKLRGFSLRKEKQSGFAFGGLGDLSFGFTLVELIVSMTIAGILMLGLSTFFASTFHNIFQAQTDSANSQRQYAVNQIVQDKLMTIDSVIDFDPSYILTFNKNTKNQMPFSYIGTTTINSEKRLAFKDIFVFNKIILDGSDYIFGDSGNGQLKNLTTGNPIPITGNQKNFAGFDKAPDGTYYVVVPDQDAIFKCSPNCISMDIEVLNMPMDIEFGQVKNQEGVDTDYLFIADSGNNRILKWDIGEKDFERDENGNIKPLATSLAFPTGLAYYEKGLTKSLFFSDTFNNKVRKINLSSAQVIQTVVGDGDSDACDNTAKFCKLNMPTGLYADTTENALYIADSGNNRILKMGDPGKPTELNLEFELKNQYALDRFNFDSEWSGDFDDENSKGLAGNQWQFDKNNHELKSGFYLTVYSDKDCISTNQSIFVDQNPNDLGLAADDFISINNTVYKIDTIGGETTCNSGDLGGVPPPPAIKKWEIKVNENINSVSSGNVVYLSNPRTPDKIKIAFDDVNWGSSSGFVTTKIDTYDKGAGGETNYVASRVGDGILGSPEDIIQVIAGNEDQNSYVIKQDGSGFKNTISNKTIQFPTGVSNAYFASYFSEAGQITKFWDATQIDLNPVFIDFSAPDAKPKFDYIADFPLDSLEFKQYNSDTILEMTIKTTADTNGNSQTYTHATSLK